MAKIPDFGSFTKKLDIQGLVDSVKSAVTSAGGPAKAPEGDEIAAKFVELITLTQTLSNQHAEQAKTMSMVYSKLSALYKDVQAFKGAAATPVENKPETDDEKK